MDVGKSSPKNESEDSFQVVASKLKFISKIKAEEVVNVHSATIQKKGPYASVCRTWHNIYNLGNPSEDRGATLTFFKNTTSDAFDLIDNFMKSDDEIKRSLGRKTLELLKESIGGIKNYSQTYDFDRMHVSTIDSLIVTLDVKIKNIEKKFD